jgi:hypothetical protein
MSIMNRIALIACLLCAAPRFPTEDMRGRPLHPGDTVTLAATVVRVEGDALIVRPLNPWGPGPELILNPSYVTRIKGNPIAPVGAIVNPTGIE